MKKHLSIWILFVIITNMAYSQNRSIEFNHGTFNELLALAKKENKLIFIDCFTTWCGPCKWMAKNIFTNDSAADFYNQNFINAKIDMEKGEGIELAKKYKVRNYPTMLYLNADGVQLHRICGSSQTKDFIRNGKNALDPEKQLATHTKNFNDGKSNAALATSYFLALDNACLSKDEEVTKYFASVNTKDFSSVENWNIINLHLTNYFSEAFQLFEADRTNFAKLYTTELVDSKINEVYMLSLKVAIRSDDMIGFETLKTKLRKSKTPEAEKIILEAEISKSKKAKDWKTYAVLVSDLISKYAAEDAGELNNCAWAFYEHVDDKNMLSKAEVWAKTATELDNSSATNDTYAAVLFKLGKKNEARTAAKKAIALANENGEDASDTEALLQKIDALQ